MIILFRMTRDITIYDTRRLCHALSLLQYHEGDRTEVDSEHIQCGTELGQIGWKPICWGLIEFSRNWTEPQKKVLQPPEIGELLSIPQAFPGSPCSPRTTIWHQLCTESSELSWISHWPRQNPQQFRYILFKYWCSTLYVMHDFNFNQYQLLINIEQIYAYIYIWLRYAYLQMSLHIILRGQHNHVGQGSAIHGNGSVLRIPRVPRPSRRRAPQHGACGQPGKMELWSRYFKEYWGNMGIGDITYYNYINYYSWEISHIISNDD